MSLQDLVGARSPRSERSPRGLVAATIATTPDDEEPVDVLIGDATQTTGPCEWMPRGDLTPTRGDPCYVQRALDGQTIVVWWGPA